MRIVLDEYNNLIAIEPPLVLGIFTLLCQPNIPCDSDILSDKNQTLVATSATQTGLNQGYKGALSAQYYTVNHISLIPKFISMKRFKYAIYPTSEKELWRIKTPDIQYKILFDANLYHVLNKKYQFMAADISRALQDTLNELTYSDNQNRIDTEKSSR